MHNKRTVEGCKRIGKQNIATDKGTKNQVGEAWHRAHVHEDHMRTTADLFRSYKVH